ncbi:MAG: hypothetical protein ABI366_02000 [Ginsengibacter sp.]
MNKTLEELKNIVSDCCVTIILQTHRTLPDNEKDPLLLKNLIREAEKRLHESNSADFVRNIMARINSLADKIDHRHNKESLILFVNEDVAEYVRLPITVENRVVVDKTFATRDLVRTLHRETSYYILILGRKKARLIEAFNNKVVDEVSEGFPLNNTDLNPAQRAEAAIGSRQSNLTREFFNRVDKQLNEVQKENPLPVIISGDESNYSEFLKIADNSERIVGNLFGNRIDDKAHHVVEAAWPVMQKLITEKNNQRLAELNKAVNSRNVLIDFNEIWQAIENGQGKTLFVKQGYFQPAKIENNHIELILPGDTTVANVDDVIDEMIEKNIQFDGDAVFINGNELEKFNGLALVTRY